MVRLASAKAHGGLGRSGYGNDARRSADGPERYRSALELAEFMATKDHTHLEAVSAKCAQIEKWLQKTENLVDDDEEIALAPPHSRGV